MAVQNDPRMYSFGAVQFDSSPSTNLYGQLLARKRAKMDALDEYDRQRMNNINSTGLRDVDRQGFDNRIQGIRDYYNQNKDKIRRGNTAEAYEFEKLYRDVGGYVNQSKERTAKQDAAMKLYQERLKQDAVVPDDFISELSINDKGIDEDGSATFDLPKWLSSPKPFNQQSFLKGFADVKRTPTIRTEEIKDQPLRLNEITEETFDIGGKQVIAARSADKYENSYSFRTQVNEATKDPTTRAKLEQTFKEQYGTNPQIPEDYATAFTMELLQPKITKSKAIDNKSSIMTRRENFAREIQNRIDNRTFSLANLRRSWQVADQTAQDEYLDEIVSGYVKSGNVAPEVTKEYEKTDGKGHKVSIEKTVFNPDGTVDFLVMDVDDPTKVDEDYSTRNVPKAQLKAKTRKVFETQMTNTGNQTIRTPKNIKDTKMTPKKKISW